jgi:hypothetical protein
MKFRSIVLAAVAVASLMLAGTILTSIQPYASGVSRNPSLRDGITEEIRADLNNTSQSITQDNVCFKSNNCRQSEIGQNTHGIDNQVTGFTDQSDNIQQSAPVTGFQQSHQPATLHVWKHVSCRQGVTCPNVFHFHIYSGGALVDPGDFVLTPAPNKLARQDIQLLSEYLVIVLEDLPPTPPNLVLTQRYFGLCSGAIHHANTCLSESTYTLKPAM